MLPRDRSSVRSGGVASGVVSIACDHSPALFLTEIRHAAFNDFLFPFVQERPANSASAEVSHVLIAAEAIDRFLESINPTMIHGTGSDRPGIPGMSPAGPTPIPELLPDSPGTIVSRS